VLALAAAIFEKAVQQPIDFDSPPDVIRRICAIVDAKASVSCDNATDLAPFVDLNARLLGKTGLWSYVPTLSSGIRSANPLPLYLQKTRQQLLLSWPHKSLKVIIVSF